MNIKPIIYSATAILLGFAIMMAPLALQAGPPTYQPELTPFPLTPTEDTNKYDAIGGRSSGESENIPSLYGLGGQPSNLLPSSFILLTGLVLAATAYITLKKRLA